MVKNISLAFSLLAAFLTTHAYTFDHFNLHAASPTWSTTSTAISPTSALGGIQLVQPIGMHNGLWTALCNKDGRKTDIGYFNEPTLRLLIAFESRIQQLSPYESTDTTMYETLTTAATGQMIHAREEDTRICVLCFRKDLPLPQLCITTEREFNGYNRTRFLENICTGELFGILDFESTQVLKVGMIENLNKMLNIITEKSNEDINRGVIVVSKHIQTDPKNVFIGEFFWSNLNCWLSVCTTNGSLWRTSPWLYCALTQPLNTAPSRESLFTHPKKNRGLFGWIKRMRLTRTNRIAPESSTAHPVWGHTLTTVEGDTSIESVSIRGD